MKMLILFLITFSTTFNVLAEELKAGDRIVDKYFYTGTVTEVFPQGKLKFQADGVLGSITDAHRNTNEVFKAYPCVENVCVGTRLIDSYGLSGTIKEIFTNGDVQFEFDGYLGLIGLAERNLKSLGYPIDCKKQVCKGSDKAVSVDKKALNDGVKIISKLNSKNNKSANSILDNGRTTSKESKTEDSNSDDSKSSKSK